MNNSKNNKITKQSRTQKKAETLSCVSDMMFLEQSQQEEPNFVESIVNKIVGEINHNCARLVLSKDFNLLTYSIIDHLTHFAKSDKYEYLANETLMEIAKKVSNSYNGKCCICKIVFELPRSEKIIQVNSVCTFCELNKTLYNEHSLEFVPKNCYIYGDEYLSNKYRISNAIKNLVKITENNYELETYEQLIDLSEDYLELLHKGSQQHSNCNHDNHANQICDNCIEDDGVSLELGYYLVNINNVIHSCFSKNSISKIDEHAKCELTLSIFKKIQSSPHCSKLLKNNVSNKVIHDYIFDAIEMLKNDLVKKLDLTIESEKLDLTIKSNNSEKNETVDHWIHNLNKMLSNSPSDKCSFHSHYLQFIKLGVYKFVAKQLFEGIEECMCNSRNTICCNSDYCTRSNSLRCSLESNEIAFDEKNLSNDDMETLKIMNVYKTRKVVTIDT
jgi:hypothetical protein